MPELPFEKKMMVIRMLLEGFSYNEISVKAGVSTGVISSIWNALKAGQYPEVSSFTEELDFLRQTATELKKLNKTPIEASVGLTVLKRLGELNLQPGEIEKCHSLVQSFAPSGDDPKAFVDAAIALQKIKKETKLDYQELAAGAKDMAEKVKVRDDLINEISKLNKQKTEADTSLKMLTNQNQLLASKNEALKKEVSSREVREAELAKRVHVWEERANKADVELTEARKDIAKLEKLGLDLPGLTRFTAEARSVAQQHEIEPKAFLSFLMEELKRLDTCVTLDSEIQARQAQVNYVNDCVSKASGKEAELKASVAELTFRRDNLRAEIDENFKQLDLITGKALEMGRGLGQYEERLKSNHWVKGLAALMREEPGQTPQEVRNIGLAITKNILAWMNRSKLNGSEQILLRLHLGNVIQELEAWQP